MSEDEYESGISEEDPLEKRLLSLEVNQTELYRKIDELKIEVHDLTVKVELLLRSVRSLVNQANREREQENSQVEGVKTEETEQVKREYLKEFYGVDSK